jgi:glycosyltransferase involved in cell wall biosynthesis
MNNFPTTTNRPLVTFALFAYNQGSYIREAVERALAQDYAPLEIILSDDASSDDTASIIREVASAYRGQSTVVVNVNAVNLGIGAHVNKIFHMAKGELIILAAGDDLSLPERTRRTIEYWIKKKRIPTAIFCGGRRIDSGGNELGLVPQEVGKRHLRPSVLISKIHDGPCIVLGACSAYTPSVMSHFGDLAADLGIEDTPLAVRASLLGGVDYINEVLVRYRINVSVWRKGKSPNESFPEHLRRLIHLHQTLHKVFVQILTDARKSGNPKAIKSAERRYAASKFVTECIDLKRFSKKEFFIMAANSKRWRKPLLLGIMYSNPTFHRLAFNIKTRLLSLFSREKQR